MMTWGSPILGHLQLFAQLVNITPPYSLDFAELANNPTMDSIKVVILSMDFEHQKDFEHR
jgi:aryl carrier-like protein